MNSNRIEKESPYVSVNFARQLSAGVRTEPLDERTLTRGNFSTFCCTHVIFFIHILSG